MPNWSSNTLIVTAKAGSPEAEAQLAEFVAKIRGAEKSDKGIFSQFYPCPQELYDNPGNGFDTWYKWHVNHWGTKWDVLYGDVTFGEGEAIGYFQMWFDTAWSPPLAFVVSVSKEYPLLSFRIAYSEGGMGFAGYTDVVNGEIMEEYEVKDVSWNYAEDDVDEEDCPEPSDEWASFMETYGLHTGG